MKATPKIYGMNMSKEEKRATLAVSRRRYAEIKGKKARGIFLDEFCVVTGLRRKRAIRALTRITKPARRNSVSET